MKTHSNNPLFRTIAKKIVCQTYIIQKNATTLNTFVCDQYCQVMEKSEASCSTNSHFDSCFPRKWLMPSCDIQIQILNTQSRFLETDKEAQYEKGVITWEQMIVQAPIWHELIYQNPMAFTKAKPNKFNQVWMMWLIQEKGFPLHICFSIVGKRFHGKIMHTSKQVYAF